MTFLGRKALAAAILIPFLAACGGNSASSGPNKAPTASATSTPTTGSTASAAPSVSSSTTPRYRQLTSDQLVNTLLGLDEMPAGYTADKPDLTDSNATFCHYRQPNRENGYAAVTFERPPASALGNTLRQYDSVADASAQQEALAKAVRHGCTMTEKGTTLKVAEMSAPKLGDRTVGVSMKSDIASYAEVFVQIGPVVIMVGEGNTGSPDITKVTAIAKKSIAKYRHAAVES